jgi:hypothetical protein
MQMRPLQTYFKPRPRPDPHNNSEQQAPSAHRDPTPSPTIHHTNPATHSSVSPTLSVRQTSHKPIHHHPNKLKPP